VRTPLAAFFSILLGLLAVQVLARAQAQFMWDSSNLIIRGSLVGANCV
jgi:hypothetical protein